MIRQAALSAFLEHGYLGTTMEEIAKRAQVARQTVYNLFESKAALLLAVIQDRVLGTEARSQADDHAAILAAADPRAMIDGLVSSSIGVAERTLPIYRIALEASVVDPAVAQHLDRNEHDRFVAQSFFIEVLLAKGVLRTDIAVADLQRGAWLLGAPATLVAATAAGWSLDQYGTWLRATMSGLLLGN
jgi:AcrR family transcriptional regulator